MNATRILSIVALVPLLSASALRADWTLRIFGAAADGTGAHTVAAPGQVRVAVGASTAGGLGVGFELEVAPRTGLELDLIAGRVTAAGRVVAGVGWVSAGTSVGFGQLGGGVNFDLAPERRVRIYLGPRIGYQRFESYAVEIVRGQEVRESTSWESEVSLGALLGAEVPLGSGRWRIAGSARWLEPLGSDRDDLLSPRPGSWMLTLGVARRF